MKGLDDEPSPTKESLTGTITNGDSMSKKSSLDLLQRLRLCREAWNPESPWDREGAHAALWGRPPGSFLVVSDSLPQNKLLCVCVGDQDSTVQDFPIISTGSALWLNTSHVAFSDLLQLVTFYTLSRDVLPLCLSVPTWVHRLIECSEHHVADLGPKVWLCPSSDPMLDTIIPGKSHNQNIVMCSIQTTTSGALCIINPLYLHEHGDDWLNQPSCSSQFEQEGWMSSTSSSSSTEIERKTEYLKKPSISVGSSGSANEGILPSITTSGVVLRRSSSSTNSESVKRLSADSIGSPLPHSPHRVSWVEDKMWMNPPPPSSFLHPQFLDLDSLSLSSVEEEPEPEQAISPSQTHHIARASAMLADKVKNRFSAALSGFICPKRRLSHRVQELSERKGTFFAESVRGFVERTLKIRICNGTSSSEMLQEVRSSLTTFREALYESTEIQSIIDSMGDVPNFQLDVMLELALHKLALKPLYLHLYECIKMAHLEDGSLQLLQENKCTLMGCSVEELEGTVGVGVPDSTMLEKIQQRWATMHQEYSPQKKVQVLLKVCKNIYHCMSTNANPGVVFGADDFLPCLTWVLLRGDVITLQIDTDYMMELLTPSQLQGEGGYYLTSLYASLFYISSFRARVASRQLSAEAHKSLSQWHHRRTLHCNQSRRSTNRRTIRRPARGTGASEISNDEHTSFSKHTDMGKTKDEEVAEIQFL